MHADAARRRTERHEPARPSTPPPSRAREALDIGCELHDLSLRYWSEARIDDAWRVGMEALRILRANLPGSDEVAEVRSTLRAMAAELGRAAPSDDEGT